MLENIVSPRDLKNLSYAEKATLAGEIRQKILSTVSKNGGHLASNLGAVELTIALHSVLNAPEDKLVFDVGHQSYAHKLLTGRYESFDTLRQKGGISGFTRVDESPYDTSCSGHASDSISLAVGMAKARDLTGGNEKVAALIGDGALSGGMCYEALNDAGQSRTRLVIVLNDNEMSISKNVGAMSRYLTHMRQSNFYRGFKQLLRRAVNKLPKGGKKTEKVLTRIRDAVKSLFVSDSFFGSLDIEYLGPVDGHDIKELERVLKKAFAYDKPVVVHCVTKKGKGYAPAEKEPGRFHSTGPFDLETGAPLKKAVPGVGAYACGILTELSEKDDSITAISAGMFSGTGLETFSEAHPERCFDVGISEEHAAALAAGLAMSGKKPFLALYSTFLQRAYDQIAIDICLNKAPVTLLIDRAGLNGPDGETHQGIYDVGLLMPMPGLTVASPATKAEVRRDMELSLQSKLPFAIRYPKTLPEGEYEAYETGSWQEILPVSDITVIASGRMVEICKDAANILEKHQIRVGLINARFLKPMDGEMLGKIALKSRIVYTVEDNVRLGGFGEAAAQKIREMSRQTDVRVLAVPDRFIPAATVEEQLKLTGLSSEEIAKTIFEQVNQ